MCGEPPKRILPVPLQLDGQILRKGLVRHPEPTHVHVTKQPQLLVIPTDLADTAEITRYILPGLGRLPQLVHVPAPKHRDDDAYYASLAPSGCPSAASSISVSSNTTIATATGAASRPQRRPSPTSASRPSMVGAAPTRPAPRPARQPAHRPGGPMTRAPIRLTHTRPSPGIPRRFTFRCRSMNRQRTMTQRSG